MTTGLVYGGQAELIWSRLLHHEMLYIRLTALRVLSGLGEAGARALLMGPTFRRIGESYPFVWALSRCIDPELFGALRVSAAPTHDLLSRARFLARRASRPHQWRYQLSRTACADSIACSDHPLETLACTVRMLEMHGEEAIPPLLELLRLPPPQVLWDEKAECAAWALGQIGSLAVPEILQEYRDASPRMSEHLATALWYLGPVAARAVPLLLKDSGHTATAALLALEEKASLEMIRARRGPVWLDEDAVQALAEIAFSEGDRAYAAAGLSCFGPAAVSGLPILRHLARDPLPEVRLNVARGLGWGGRPEAMSLLAELAEDPDAQVVERAQRSMENYFSSPTEMQVSLLATLRSGDELERRRAAEQLARIGIAEEEDISDLLVPGLALNPLLEALGRSERVPLRYRPKILELMSLTPIRAGRLLARWPDDASSRESWRPLLWDPFHEAQDLAVAAVKRSGLRLGEWGLSGEELLGLPSRVVGELFASVRPSLLETRDLLVLLRRLEPEAHLAAALALRASAPPLAEVEEALEEKLRGLHSAVAVECARTLVALGGNRHRWGMLRSSKAFDREMAMFDGDLPENFAEEYIGGPLYGEKNSALLAIHLGVQAALEIEVQAMVRLLPPAGPKRLAGYGQPALDRLPELLGHPSPPVRRMARDTLKELLRSPAESHSEWLARHGLVLPLEDGGSPAEIEDLQGIVCDYMQRAQLWSDQRLRPLWLILIRSSLGRAAVSAVDALARSYLQSPTTELLEALLLALDHPEEVVRRAALRRVGSHVAAPGWTPPFRSYVSPEQGLVMLARRFADGDPDLEPNLLQQALELLIRWRLEDCHFFTPDSPERLLVLLSLAGRSPYCDSAIHRLFWSYRGQTPRALWQRLQELSLDPAFASFHAPLAERWPRLVLFAMGAREDWLEWLLLLGSCAKTGLRQALKHEKSIYRLRALEVLARLDQGFGAYYRVVLDLAQNDPDPDVQALARTLTSRNKR